MKTARLFASTVCAGALAFAGCRGSVDRAYFDDLDGSADLADASSTSSSGGDGGARDATADAPVGTEPATIRGTVIGLAGAGLVLQNNGGDDLEITAGGAFAFSKRIATGQAYDVGVRSQPSGPTQKCAVTKGSGVATGVDVNDVLVTCTTEAYPVGGTVVGLEAGKTLVLTNNGANDLTIGENGTFTFANNVPSGANFNVLVKTQPGVGADCTVSGGSGTVVTSGVDTVVVNCASGTFTVGGTVTGLAGTLEITDAVGAVTRTISANGAFAFPAPKANGAQYDVSVTAAPTWPPANQTCAVQNGQGTVSGANVSSVAIACTTTSYPVGGTLAGLGAGKTIVLTINGGNDLTLNADGAFAFGSNIASGGNYDVAVKTQPSGTICTISGGSGDVTTGPVAGVVVNCTANSFTVGGNVTGLSGTLVLRSNGVDRTVSSNGNFSFPPLPNGTSYDVTVKTQPSYYPVSQTCAIASGSGTISGANVTSVKVTCTTNRFSVGGNVTGLTAAGLVLRNNGGDDEAVATSGAFAFDTTVASGGNYSVSVYGQPAGQFCTLTSAQDVVKNGNITNVSVSCVGNVLLGQNFDSAVRPGLPTGWTQEVLLPSGSTGWRTASDSNRYRSPPNAAYIPNYNSTRDFALVSPAFTVTTATAKLSFWNRYDVEEDWDGGVLEIKIGAGAWQDILAAGGSFTSGGYDCTLESDPINPLAGRDAWCGFRVVTTVANLPAAAMGQSVQLRWRMGTDDGADEVGWWIDDVVVTSN